MRKLFFEACLAGIWLALAWSLRGQFGHLQGALIPGACLALVPAFCMHEEHWREAIGQALILGSLGFAIGGHISYGGLFDAVAHASAFGEVKKEFWQLLAIGLVWGGLGATFLGFGFSEKNFRLPDFWVLGAVILAWFFLLGILNLEAWDLVSFTAGLVLIHIYNLFFKKSSIVWMLGLIGALAWGGAFLLSAIFLSAGYQGYLGQGWPWWVLRDQILGFAAGVLFWLMASGLQNFRFRRRSAENILTVQRAGFFVWLVLIPVLNTWNAAAHWLIFKSFERVWMVFLFCGGFLLFLGGMVLLKPDMDFLNPKLRRTLGWASFFFTAYLIGIGIAKQWLVLGKGHWEDAYSFFIFSFAVLCGLLPFQIRYLSKGN